MAWELRGEYRAPTVFHCVTRIPTRGSHADLLENESEVEE